MITRANLPNQHHTYQKLEKVIDSCVHLQQLDCAINMTFQYGKLYNINLVTDKEYQSLFEQVKQKFEQVKHINQTN